jgi:hypothetical protein
MVDSWLLFGHLAGVALLVTGVGLEGFAGATASRAGTLGELWVMARIGRVLAVIMPIAVLTLVGFGVALVARDSAEFSFGDAWVVGAMGIVVFMVILGGGVNARHFEKLTRAVGAAPGDQMTPELRALAAHPVTRITSRVGGILTLTAIWLMTIKPSMSGAFVALGVAAVLSAGAALSAKRLPSG